VEWIRSNLDGVSTIYEVKEELKNLRGSLWDSLVASGKITRKDDSGNLLRIQGRCTLTVSITTHIVPIAVVGKPPSVEGLALEIGTIAHVKKGRILVEAGSTVLFEYYSQSPDGFEISSLPRGDSKSASGI